MIDVTDRTDVHVWFRSYELFLSHDFPTLFFWDGDYGWTLFEPTIRFELMTSSLPRTCSTN